MKFTHELPRYTSYPAVTRWSREMTASHWTVELRRALAVDEKLSLYVHLPFCESLCSYCGCNTTITKNHDMEERYLDLIEKEWQIYQDVVPELAQSKIQQIYLGGGSPNFFSPKNLRRLLALFHERFVVRDELDAVVEFDPRRVNQDQLAVCHDEGFSTVSFGIEDLNLHVQSLINRVQSYSELVKTVEIVRSIGFDTLAFDLIYGLPNQGVPEIQLTVNKSLDLEPDRVAIYALASGPWLKSHQNVYDKAYLAEAEEKENLRLEARKIFLQRGYHELGLDHYVKTTDCYWQAQSAGLLHKNFCGYTKNKTSAVVGLGVSAISETATSYFQNEKVLNLYERQIGAGELAGFRGKLLGSVAIRIKKHIIELQTQFSTQVTHLSWQQNIESELKNYISSGAMTWVEGRLSLKEEHRSLVRQACKAVAHCAELE